MVRVAVIGGGLLGSVAALSAAARGWDVDLIEARADLMSAASAVNEGKVHLGPVFALGDSRTHEVMLRGALAFAPLLEEALAARIDWPAISTEPFDYLVMPTSLLDVTSLAKRYAEMNSRFEQLSARLGRRYLGRDLDRLVDPQPQYDPSTGFPTFTTTERAVDPLLLRKILLAGLDSMPTITTHVSRRVLSLTAVPGGTEVSWQEVGAEPKSSRYAFVVNCAWESRLALAPDAAGTEYNFRLKTAVRLPRATGGRTVTLVQGPFGDVVTHRDYVYASWYPEGRLSNEFGRAPSRETLRLLDVINASAEEGHSTDDWRNSLVERQLMALQRLNLLPDDVEAGELIGGVLLGHGRRDIDRSESQLHSRAEFGSRHRHGVITPLNFKLTTAPLAATRAIEAIESAMAATVLT